MRRLCTDSSRPYLGRYAPRAVQLDDDTVNHDLLMCLLWRTIRDKRLLALIGRYLRAGAAAGHKAS